jgi:hypothetical protein
MNVKDIIIPLADYPRLRAGNNLYLRADQDPGQVVVLKGANGVAVADSALIVIPVDELMLDELVSDGSTGYTNERGIFSIRLG